ncbi:50S ribosomal protein L29 [Candidatus Woesearchaeota archaeon]|nr:50S ribosomal protein L29 [Candidatus Woesearchaeota archaeon]
MKKKELKKINSNELASKLAELKKELMKYRAQIATGTPPQNPGRVKLVRKTIARMNFMLQKSSEAKKPKEVTKKVNA